MKEKGQSYPHPSASGHVKFGHLLLSSALNFLPSFKILPDQVGDQGPFSSRVDILKFKSMLELDVDPPTRTTGENLGGRAAWIHRIDDKDPPATLCRGGPIGGRTHRVILKLCSRFCCCVYVCWWGEGKLATLYVWPRRKARRLCHTLSTENRVALLLRLFLALCA